MISMMWNSQKNNFFEHDVNILTRPNGKFLIKLAEISKIWIRWKKIPEAPLHFKIFTNVRLRRVEKWKRGNGIFMKWWLDLRMTENIMLLYVLYIYAPMSVLRLTFNIMISYDISFDTTEFGKCCRR